MTGGFDLDHTSFAVRDALDWATRLRRELGAVPVAGEALAEFRYLLLYVGTAEAGARLELLEPVADGFLTRFLDTHGEGPHHLTFTVPDLKAAVGAVRTLGLTVVGESYDHPGWREAFVVPDDVHGTVIQLAQTDLAYPPPAELLASRDRDTQAFPSTLGATEPRWWISMWDTPVEGQGRLGTTYLGSTDLTRSRQLFAGALGADVEEVDGSLLFRWTSGSVHVRPSSRPGIIGMTLARDRSEGLRIGDALLTPNLQ